MESPLPHRPARTGAGEHAGELDARTSAALDRLTRWAARALRVPIAAVMLVEGDCHRGASTNVEVEASEHRRLAESCQRIVVARRPQAVQHLDGRAFLGAPLVDHTGRVAGTFCVVDSRARDWDAGAVEMLCELATSAMTELELQAACAEAEREKRWSSGQRNILELIAGPASLERTLTELMRVAEAHAPGMLASIMLLESVRGRPGRLRIAAGPSLPPAFASAIDGIEVGEGRGICATAAHRAEQVIIADMAHHPLTAGLAKLAAAHGVRAAWSSPVASGSGAVLGTFALYGAAGTPGAGDQLVIDRCVHLARLAIEQADGARMLRRTVSRAKLLAREQTALQRVATRVAEEADPQALAALVAEQVGQLLKADCGYVLRHEGEDSYLTMGSWGRDPDLLMPVGAVARQSPDGLCAHIRRAPTVRRRSVEAGSDHLRLRHRIAAPVIVDGNCWGMVVALRDGSEFRREDEKRITRFAQLASVAVANVHARRVLAHQARTDPLTGLANRRAFDARLAEETERARRHKRALSVMLVDVDRFKAINDRFGHATGDRVLVNLADHLREAMRTEDLVARVGGDEMAIVLPDCTVEQAALVARRMLAAIAEPTSLARRHGVTLSAGVAGLTGGQTAEDLLRSADKALYRAKAEGRNQVVSCEPGPNDPAALPVRS